MTYLLDDLEAASLIERCPDPADRRARRIVASQEGNDLLASLNDRLRAAEAHLLAPLAPRGALLFVLRFGCSPPNSILSTRPTSGVTLLTR
jgi:DNA-binding MarR family transcriptional regulator